MARSRSFEEWFNVKDVQDGKLYCTIESADSRWEGSSWAKKVIDVSEGEAGGYAFKGDWLYMAKGKNRIRKEVALEKGDVVLVVQCVGSNKYHRQKAYVIYITKDLEPVLMVDGLDFREDIRTLKKMVKELLLRSEQEMQSEEIQHGN